MAPWALLFLLGAAVGTLLDHLHVACAVLRYPAPFLFAQAAWVPGLFGIATAGFVRLWQLGCQPTRRAIPPSRVVLAILRFAAAYALTALSWQRPRALTALLLGSFLALASGRGFARRLAYGIAVAALGASIESALSLLGGFHYVVPTTLRVPIWLPGLYLHASLLMPMLDAAFFGRRSARLAPTWPPPTASTSPIPT